MPGHEDEAGTAASAVNAVTRTLARRGWRWSKEVVDSRLVVRRSCVALAARHLMASLENSIWVRSESTRGQHQRGWSEIGRVEGQTLDQQAWARIHWDA